jgi:hypothetical protein
MFSQFRQCLVSWNRDQGHLSLESWCVIPSRPFHARALLWAVLCTGGLSKTIIYY